MSREENREAGESDAEVKNMTARLFRRNYTNGKEENRQVSKLDCRDDASVQKKEPAPAVRNT